MRQLRALLVRFAGLFTGRRREQELADEIASHIELHAEEYRRNGMTASEARRRAIVQLGGKEATMQSYRDQRTLPMLEAVVQDVRFALRQLRHHPGFTVVAVMMLALGICASVTLFTFVDAALIRPLPYKEPNRLVEATELVAKIGPANLSYPDYLDWLRENREFESLAAWSANAELLTAGGTTQPVRSMHVTANFFHTLGTPPLVGRDFRAGEDLAGSSRTVMLSYAAWQQFFGGRPDVVGSVIQLSGRAHTVVGVMPPGFQFAPRGRAMLWTALHPDSECDLRRGCHDLIGVARLKDGVSVGQADGAMKLLARRLEEQYPDSNRGQGGVVRPLSESVLGGIRPILLTLLGGAGLLLLIAMLNVAGLLLARSDSRRREFALRGALGASAGRLVRQFATESVLLVALGTALGLVGAALTLRLLITLIPAVMMQGMPYLGTAALDGHAWLFAGAVALTAMVLFALVPVPGISMTRLRAGMQEGSQGGGSRTWRRFGSKLVILELAIAVVLLVGAGLLTKSLYQLLNVQLGFEPSHLATIRVALPAADFPKGEQQAAVQRGLIERVAALPGVQSVGIGAQLPVSYNGNTDWIRFVGRPYDGHHTEVLERNATPRFFETLGARMVRGRTFTDADGIGKPLVVVINRRLAEQYFPGEDPIGKQFGNTGLKPDSIKTIVGVVDDIKEGPLDSEIWPAAYYAEYQSPDSYFALIVRTSGSDQSLLPTLQATVRGYDARLATDDVGTMDAMIHDSRSAYLHRGAAWLVGAFACVALLLSAVGLYGVIAYSVSQRTREIGVRMALGAQRSTVYQLILKEACWLSVGGIGLGLGLSIGASTLIHDLLFQVRSWDLPTLAGVTAVLGACALIASYVPAHRAASVNPVDALRAE